ncbi:protachykinin-1 isoform X2 [Nelusetta ayraudi]|uniref:protachykinin-1 isoform X2 n=1 Tax=Nelusetta ayraudi TaxID=303726 RepID=UPI003F702CCF
MKLLLLHIFMALCGIAHIFADEIDTREDGDQWTGSNQIKNTWIPSNPFREMLLRMTRKPRPHQFIGLMGKRSMGQKVSSFVGLMGKRSQDEPDYYEWSPMQIYEQQR